MFERFTKRSTRPLTGKTESGARVVEAHFPPHVRIVSYDKDGTAMRDLGPREAVWPEIFPGKVNWIRVIGIHDSELIKAVGKRFSLHPLIVEDILDPGQRPRFEDYGNISFLALKLLSYSEEDRLVLAEQVCLIIGETFILTFEQSENNVFDSVEQKSIQGTGRLRNHGLGHLLYALLDATLDDYFTTIGAIAEDIEEVEENLLAAKGEDTLFIIYRLKREALFLHKTLWPLREALSRMLKEDFSFSGKEAGYYLGNAQQDALQVIEAVDTLREMLSEMLGVYMTRVDLRMNAIGQYLSVIATIFIPLTFVTGVYGMNFIDMPLTRKPWGFWAISIFMAAVCGVMVFFFNRRKWFRINSD
jgi:magnesium transporter